MYKNNNLIPKLRFPEFKDDGEWVENKLDEVFESFSGGTPTTSNKEYYGGNIPFIRSAEINKEKTELFITEEGLNNSSAKIVNKGDLLVALYGANSGDSAISKINGAINQAILCLRSEYSNDFTYYFLTYRKKEIISKFIQGGQGNLSGDIIKSILLPFPSKQEQQKIAECLSSLEELIEARKQKLALLKQHKKGLMQNLFPIENGKLKIENGELRIENENNYQFSTLNFQLIPKLRFPEFKDEGEWEEKKLGEVGEIVTGTTPSTKISEYYENGIYPWVTPTDITENKDIIKTKKQLTEKGLKAGRFIPKNSLLVTCIASIGKNIILRTDGSCNQQINAIIPNISYDVDFLYYLTDVTHKNSKFET